MKTLLIYHSREKRAYLDKKRISMKKAEELIIKNKQTPAVAWYIPAGYYFYATKEKFLISKF